MNEWKSYTDDNGDFQLANFLYKSINELMKNSLDVDQKDPNKILDQNFWKTMEDNLSQWEEWLPGISINLIHVLTNFAGKNWQKRMPNVELCFEFYVVFWKEHANFK